VAIPKLREGHRGLVEAIGATLPGASWQRCRTHYAEPDGRHPEEQPAVGAGAAALGL
jgi:hypothetical protein